MNRDNIRRCAAGRMGGDDALSDEEFDKIIDAIEGRLKEGHTLKSAVDPVVGRLQKEKALAKRNAMLAASARRRALVQISRFREGKGSAFTADIGVGGQRGKQGNETGTFEFKGGGEADIAGLEAWLANSNQRSALARGGFQAARAGWQNKLVGEFIRELSKHEDIALFLKPVGTFVTREGAIDRDVARELWEMSRKRNANVGVTKNPEALKVAKIVKDYLNLAMYEQNKMGAWIEPVEGFIATQVHVPRKLQKAGYAKWKQYLLEDRGDGKGPRLDVARTFYDPTKPPLSESQLDERLQEVYANLSSGTFTDDLPVGNEYVFDGSGNAAKKASEHRVLHFRDSDSFVDYNSQFGQGALFESIVSTLTRAAQVGAMLEKFGPNPDATFKYIEGTIAEANKTNPKVKEYLRSNRWATFKAAATGELDAVNNIAFAHVSEGVRVWQRMASLGAALISSFGDPVLHATRLEANGVPWASAIKQQVDGMLVGRADAQEIAEATAFALEHLTRDILTAYNEGDGAMKAMGRAQHHFFTVTGLNWWEGARERAVAAGLSLNAWRNAGKEMSALNPDFRASLVSAGIGKTEWELIRKHATLDLPDVNGGVIDPNLIRRVTDDELRSAYNMKKSSAAGLDRKRGELERLWRSYLADQLEWTLLKPGLREKAYGAGYNPSAVKGTVVGEGLKQLMLFKSYPTQYLQRVIGSLTEEDKVGRIMLSAVTGRGQNLRMMKLIGSLFVIGTAIVYLRDTLKNRTPRDITDPRTLMAGMIQGGGLGIYADFLYSAESRVGSGPIGTLAGPTFSDAELLADTVVDMRNGIVNFDEKRMKEAGDNAFKFLKSNVPGANIFWVRPAADYLIWNNVQETLNPGAMMRQRERMMEGSGQDFLVDPMME